jgi:hypothetical protein
MSTTPEDLLTLAEHKDEVLQRLSALERRLSALERHLRLELEPRAILVPSQMLHGDPTAGRVRYEGAPRPGDPSVRALPPAPTSSAYASGAPIVVRPPADASADALELAGVRPGDPSAQ